MRSFAEISHTAGLKKFLESRSGMLYFDAERPAPTMIVRQRWSCFRRSPTVTGGAMCADE